MVVASGDGVPGPLGPTVTPPSPAIKEGAGRGPRYAPEAHPLEDGCIVAAGSLDPDRASQL